jgi:tight adherence protein C
MSRSVIGALLGLLLVTGIGLVLGGLHATRRPTLAQIVAAYVPRSAPRPTAPTEGPLMTVVRLLRPSLGKIGVIGFGVDSIVVQRLQRAGRPPDVDRHRLEQLAISGLGFLVGLVIAGISAIRGAPIGGLVVLAVVGAVLGFLIHDYHLSRVIAQRQRRIQQQLPNIAELLAFAVAAGESPNAAFHRIASTVTGDLSAEISEAVLDMRAGTPFDLALRQVSVRCGSVDVERFIDGILLSIERGTPLVEVLRAQAADARAADHRQLMEIAGRKDVAMLIPIVFVILPTVVLIALFPGIRGLQMIVNT